GGVRVWDRGPRREVLTLDGFAREVTHVRFTKDGRDLVAGTGIDLLPMMVADVGPREQVWPPAEVRVFRGGRGRGLTAGLSRALARPPSTARTQGPPLPVACPRADPPAVDLSGGGAPCHARWPAVDG